MSVANRETPAHHKECTWGLNIIGLRRNYPRRRTDPPYREQMTEEQCYVSNELTACNS